MKKKNIILSCILTVSLILIGVSFGYWAINRTQEEPGVYQTSCLDFTLEDVTDAIYLRDAAPMSDEDGEELTPYIFKVTNTCDLSLKYQVSLETLRTDNNYINDNAIKIKFNDNTPVLLNSLSTVDTTLNDAVVSYKLLTDQLAPHGSKEHSLILWLDQDAPIENASNELVTKLYKGKITVITGDEVNNS